MRGAQSAEEWQAVAALRIERLAQAQRDQRRRFLDAGACEVCGSPDASSVADLRSGDGVRLLCAKDRKEAGLEAPPVALPYAE